jgi:glutathione S-transferase
LFESGAIVQTICEEHAQAGLAPNVGDAERAHYLEMLSYAETMAGLIEQLNMQHLFLRDLTQASPVVIKLTTARLAATLAGFERMLEGRDHVLVRGFSSADIMMGFNLFAAPYYVKMGSYPVLTAYAKRLAARPAYQTARSKDGEQDFYTQDFYPVPEG